MGVYLLHNHLKTYERSYYNLAVDAARTLDDSAKDMSEEERKEMLDIAQYRNPPYIADKKEYDFDVGSQFASAVNSTQATPATAARHQRPSDDEAQEVQLHDDDKHWRRLKKAHTQTQRTLTNQIMIILRARFSSAVEIITIYQKYCLQFNINKFII